MWDQEEAIRYYKSCGAPGDQTALVSLLKEIQQECGGVIPAEMLTVLAERLGVKQSFLEAVIKRIPSLRVDGRPVLEVCAGPNCGKRQELVTFLETNYGKNPGNFQWKCVPCMRLCGKGPNVKWKGQLYHQVDVKTLRKLLET